ncbi:hypothetical protein CHH28_03870 [Bacterioplanes sanyensis]|uniref:Uncharacterized protein n=1 Tax=Bacterioplanes sanyensis TaxID=1249553 RepID=A0A222FI21_9GAMM|nr:phage tail tube protein [Bacterioplanes sanyensis]ASP37863.1 hypothetical protein CHH28_03870 [Bacterioplanes sanyensis]
MKNRTNRRLLLAAIENTYGDDAAPTAALNAVLTRSISLTPLAGEDVQRQLDRPYFGNAQTIAGEKHVELTVEVELAGSGTAGNAPAWSPLMRACGFKETVNAGTDVVYDPVTGAEESLTAYINRDSVLHKFTGGRGSVSFTFDVNNIPVMSFTFKGLFSPIANGDMPTDADFSAYQTPMPVTAANTPAFTLHGQALSFNQLSMDMAVEVVKHQVVGNSSSIEINGRAPSGSATVEEPDLATINLYEKARNGDLGTLSLTHGTDAGNIVQIDCPQVGTGAPTESDLNGMQMLQIPLTINPNSGNDEIRITVK